MSLVLRRESRQRYPRWTRSMRAKWVLAKLATARIPRKVVVSKYPVPSQQFFERTMPR